MATLASYRGHWYRDISNHDKFSGFSIMDFNRREQLDTRKHFFGESGGDGNTDYFDRTHRYMLVPDPTVPPKQALVYYLLPVLGPARRSAGYPVSMWRRSRHVVPCPRLRWSHQILLPEEARLRPRSVGDRLYVPDHLYTVRLFGQSEISMTFTYAAHMPKIPHLRLHPDLPIAICRLLHVNPEEEPMIDVAEEEGDPSVDALEPEELPYAAIIPLRNGSGEDDLRVLRGSSPGVVVDQARQLKYEGRVSIFEGDYVTTYTIEKAAK